MDAQEAETIKAKRTAHLHAANRLRKAAGLPVGRQRGTPNKLTAVARNALLQAFEDIGGSEALAHWGRTHRAAFYALFFKSIPKEREANAIGTGVQIIIGSFADAPRVIDVTPAEPDADNPTAE
jgi:hypothetical protein